jgi:sec-independent protein translocase protein TatA
MNLGPTELLIVLAIVLLLFGSAKLPKLARSLGQASKEFRHGTDTGGTNSPVGSRRRMCRPPGPRQVRRQARPRGM